MRSTLILAILLGISLSSFSQLLFKAKAGLNLSRMERPRNPFFISGEDSKQSDKFGPHIGGAVEYQFKKRLSLQAELMYSLKGFKAIDHSPYTGDYKHGYDFHYVELPLLLRYSFSNNFRIGAGPYIAVLVSGKEKVKSDFVFDLETSFTKLDFGLNGDLSYAFKRFEIFARYNYGLRMVTEVWDQDAEITGSGDKHEIGKNRTFQVGVAYLIRKLEVN